MILGFHLHSPQLQLLVLRCCFGHCMLCRIHYMLDFEHWFYMNRDGIALLIQACRFHLECF